MNQTQTSLPPGPREDCVAGFCRPDPFSSMECQTLGVARARKKGDPWFRIALLTVFGFGRLCLPGKVSKRLVGIRHPVHVLPLGHCCPFTTIGCHQFVGQ